MAGIDAYCVIGLDGNGDASEDKLLELMDDSKVERAAIHPPDECCAFYNEVGNERLIKASRAHPDRFIAVATVNPWRSDCWEVIKRALDQGARLLSFSPGVQGFNPAGPMLDKLLGKLAQHSPSAPIYMHTGHHSFGAPSQLMLLAGRHQKLKFLMGHSGATDYALDLIPVMQRAKNLFAETSFSRPPAVKNRIKTIGAGRFIMGSGWPYNRLDFEWSEIRRVLTPEAARDVCGGNMERLLGEKFDH